MFGTFSAIVKLQQRLYLGPSLVSARRNTSATIRCRHGRWRRRGPGLAARMLVPDSKFCSIARMFCMDVTSGRPAHTARNTQLQTNVCKIRKTKYRKIQIKFP